MTVVTWTEVWSSFTPSGTGWQNYDIYTNKSVPKGAIAYIVIANENDAADRNVGVRTDGSSLERRMLLHEAESGPATTMSMHVKVDATTGYIETYCDNTTGVTFYLAGYWQNIDFTELWSVQTSGSGSGWTTLTSAPYASRVMEVVCAHDASGAAVNCGIRDYSSSANRYISVHEAEGGTGARNTYTSHSLHDSSGRIQVYYDTTYYANQYYAYAGYFGSDMQYSESCFATSDTALSSWTNITGFSSYLDQKPRVVDIAVSNSSRNTEEYCGARKDGTTTERKLYVHEAETNGVNPLNLPTETDSTNGYIEGLTGGQYTLLGFFKYPPYYYSFTKTSDARLKKTGSFTKTADATLVAQKIITYKYLLGERWTESVTVRGTIWNSLTTVKPTTEYRNFVYYDSSKSTSPTVVFQVRARGFTSNNTYVSLYDYGTDDDVDSATGTEVSGSGLTWTSSAEATKQATVTLTNGHRYGIQGYNVTTASTQVACLDACLIFEETVSTLSAHEEEILLNMERATTTGGSYTVINNTGRWKYNSSEWNGSPTFYFEAVVRSYSSSYTGYATLWDYTDDAAVSGAEVSTSTGNNTRLRSSSITLTDGHIYGFKAKSSATPVYNVYINKAAVIVQQSSPTKLVVYRPLGNYISTVANANYLSTIVNPALIYDDRYPSDANTHTVEVYYSVVVDGEGALALVEYGTNTAVTNTEISFTTTGSYHTNTTSVWTPVNGKVYGGQVKSATGAANICQIWHKVKLSWGTGATTKNFTKTADARLLKTQSFTKTSDARLKKEYSFTKTSDARLKSTNSFTKYADSRLKKTQSFTKNADARLKKTQQFTKTADAFLHYVRSFTKTADARLRKTYALTKYADSRLVKTQSFTKNADARLKGTLSFTKFSDARLKKTQSFTKTSDARLLKTQQFTKTADATLQLGAQTKSFTKYADARLKKTQSFTKTSDAFLHYVRSFTKTADARLLKTQSFTKQSDARLKKTQSFTKLSDARLVKTYSFTKYADSRLLKKQQFTKTADAFLHYVRSFTKNADARLKKTQQITKTADAFLHYVRSFTKTSDARLLKTQSFTKLSDARLLKTQSFTKTADAKLTSVKSFTKFADARLLKTQSFTKTADARLVKTYSFTKNADSRLLKTQSFTKLSDSRLKKTQQFTKTSDAFLHYVRSFTKTADAKLILEANLKARYDMETTDGGLLKDFSGYGNNGTGYGSITFGDITGINLDATDFDCNNDYVDLGTNSSITNIASNKLSLVVWVSPDSLPNSLNPVIVSDIYSLYITNDGKVTVKLKLGGTVYTKTFGAASSVPTGSWTQIAFTFDGTNWDVYINASAQTTQTQAGTLDSTSNSVKLGRSSV